MNLSEINAAIHVAKAQYHEAAQTQIESVWRPLSDKVIALTKLRSDFLSQGAVACKGCGASPLGYRKGKGDFRILCVNCLVHSSAESAPEAVEEWNKDMALVD